jgi:hypothetical protein
VEIAEFTSLAVKTVKNSLTGLRKQLGGTYRADGEPHGTGPAERPCVPTPYKGQGWGRNEADHTSEDLKEVRELFVKDTVEESR